MREKTQAKPVEIVDETNVDCLREFYRFEPPLELHAILSESSITLYHPVKPFTLQELESTIQWTTKLSPEIGSQSFPGYLIYFLTTSEHKFT